jgi:hypothetical protein
MLGIKLNYHFLCEFTIKYFVIVDIGGFVGLYLFDEVYKIKDNKEIMGFSFGNKRNLEQ